MSTAPVPLMKFPPSVGSLYVLHDSNSTNVRGSEIVNVQRNHDLSFSILCFELRKVCRVRRGLIVFVVYPRALDPHDRHITMMSHQSGQLDGKKGQ